MMKPEDFGPFTLSKSSHSGPAEGMCVMEMVSFLAGEEWSDMPPCASPVVARFCQVVNDRFDQSVRDRLQAYVPRLIGTVSPEHEQERAEFLAWQAIRVFAPIALRSAGMNGHADALAGFEGTLSAAARAADAADAADAAADAAAYAARASADAAYAAYAAYAAADAARAGGVEAMFSTLDGLLDIGPSGDGYTQDHMDRAVMLKKSVEVPA